MSFTGHVVGGVVVFDGPAPPDGTAVRVEPTANGVPKPPAPPANNSDIDPDGVMSPRMIELVRQSQAENPDGPTLADEVPSLGRPFLDLPEDASAQVDHYLYGTPKR
jgi:hypothetical protein